MPVKQICKDRNPPESSGFRPDEGLREMKTIIRKMMQPDRKTAEEAARIWRAGGLVAFPTETVYGLGGNGLDASASEKIYAAKCRPSDNPLILHIAERSQLDGLVRKITPQAEKLMKTFWPGPLTLIFEKSEQVPLETTGGLQTAAIRMPSHPVAHYLLQTAGIPIAAPSANRSGRPSPTTAHHVIEDLDGRIDMIIDGGDVGIGVESTIVDLTGDIPCLLRPGYITVEDLEAAVGKIDLDPAIYHQVSANVHPKAPGMKYRHYAPKADMAIVQGYDEAVVSYINRQIALHPDQKIGVLATTENASKYQGGLVLCVGDQRNMAEVAHNLFGALRRFDDLGVDQIYSESFTTKGEGLAVMNRLMKAAGHTVIRLEGADNDSHWM